MNGSSAFRKSHEAELIKWDNCYDLEKEHLRLVAIEIMTYGSSKIKCKATAVRTYKGKTSHCQKVVNRMPQGADESQYDKNENTDLKQLKAQIAQ